MRSKRARRLYFERVKSVKKTVRWTVFSSEVRSECCRSATAARTAGLLCKPESLHSDQNRGFCRKKPPGLHLCGFYKKLRKMEYTIIVPMDMNGDGKVNSSDARAILRAAAKLDSIDGIYFTAADSDNNKKINSSDARRALRVAAKLDEIVLT